MRLFKKKNDKIAETIEKNAMESMESFWENNLIEDVTSKIANKFSFKTTEDKEDFMRELESKIEDYDLPHVVTTYSLVFMMMGKNIDYTLLGIFEENTPKRHYEELATKLFNEKYR